MLVSFCSGMAFQVIVGTSSEHGLTAFCIPSDVLSYQVHLMLAPPRKTCSPGSNLLKTSTLPTCLLRTRAYFRALRDNFVA